MKAILYSRLARADLMEIGAYTLRTWGERQVICYLNQLEGCSKRICEQPLLGKSCESVRPGLRRFECQKHVFYYRFISERIVVSRILHRSMMPGFHEMDDVSR